MRQEKRLAENSEVSEKAIERYLCRLVKETGGLCLKYSSGNTAGYPDRVLLYPGGRTGWVEVKSSGRNPTPLQSIRIVQLRGFGFRVWVCDSREKAESIVREMQRMKKTVDNEI